MDDKFHHPKLLAQIGAVCVGPICVNIFVSFRILIRYSGFRHVGAVIHILSFKMKSLFFINRVRRELPNYPWIIIFSYKLIKNLSKRKCLLSSRSVSDNVIAMIDSLTTRANVMFIIEKSIKTLSLSRLWVISSTESCVL